MLYKDVVKPTSDREAVEHAYRKYGLQIWRGVLTYTGGRREIADDAVAEAFARALERPDKIRSLEPWLYRVAFRYAASALREERQHLAVLTDEGASLPRDLDPRSRPLGALATLPAEQRAVIFLFYYADKSIVDIARVTGSSTAAVRVWLHRARKALRDRYDNRAILEEST
jgi:RNA polymerase sigma factor (sigma-70 family)